MWIRSSVPAMLALLAVQPAAAQQSQPDVQILAQAYDRCMATYAVRLTRTDATDADIFTQATAGCQALDDRVRAAITAQLPPARATEVLHAIDAQGEPDFMALLARIRSDRATNAGE